MKKLLFAAVLSSGLLAFATAPTSTEQTIETKLKNDIMTIVDQVNPVVNQSTGERKYISFGFISDIHKCKRVAGDDAISDPVTDYWYGSAGCLTESEPTIRLLGSVASDAGLDAIINGGDLSTAPVMGSKKFTVPEYTNEIWNVKAMFDEHIGPTGVPFFTVDGNHDRNYSPIVMSDAEWAYVLTNFNSSAAVAQAHGVGVTYHRDLPDAKISGSQFGRFEGNSFHLDFRRLYATKGYNVRIGCLSAYDTSAGNDLVNRAYDVGKLCDDSGNAIAAGMTPENTIIGLVAHGAEEKVGSTSVRSASGSFQCGYMTGYSNPGSKSGPWNGAHQGLGFLGLVCAHYHFVTTKDITDAFDNLVNADNKVYASAISVASAYAVNRPSKPSEHDLETEGAYHFSIFVVDKDQNLLREVRIGGWSSNPVVHENPVVQLHDFNIRTQMDRSAPVFGSVTVTPSVTSAALAGSVSSLGTDATACDVYLSLNDGAATKIAEGVTSSFNYEIADLTASTTYSYTLTVSNNAATAKSVTKSGSFTTQSSAVPPEEDPDGDDDPVIPPTADAGDLSDYKWAVIGDSLSDPTLENNTDGPLKYYHFLQQSSGIKCVYTNAVGGTGYKNGYNKAADKLADGGCFYQRLEAHPIPLDVDVVTIFGSINDGGFAETDENLGTPTDSLEDKTTLAAYMNKAIDLVRSQAPNAKIVLIGGIYFSASHATGHVRLNAMLGQIAAVRKANGDANIVNYDWLTEDPNDPLDFHKITVNFSEDGCFGSQYTYDWKTRGKINESFGHPNPLYNEIWLAPHFGEVLATELRASLGDVTTTPASNACALASSVISLGTADATACDVYLAYGTDENNLGAATKVLSGLALDASVDYTIEGLEPGTKYYFELSVTNNAAIPAGNMKKGSFVTKRVTTAVPGLGAFGKKIVFTLKAGGMPVLLKLSEAIDGFRYSDCNADGSDICFADAEDEAASFEFEQWNPSGESLVWVKVPAAEGETTVTMYYSGEPSVENNPSDVWTSYTGVWHFNELGMDATANSQGAYANSTAVEGLDGHLSTYSVPDEAGVIGKSFKVNDSKPGYHQAGYEYGGVWVVDAGEDSPLDANGVFTISGWFKHNGTYVYNNVIGKRNDNGNSSEPKGAFFVRMHEQGSDPVVQAYGSNGSVELSSETERKANMIDNWVYLTFVYNGTTCTIYENGEFCKSGSITAATNNNAPLVFGNGTAVADGAAGNAWRGWIDEARYTKGVAMTAAQVATEYAAMADAEFATSDGAENVDGTVTPKAPKLGEVTVTPAITNATIAGTITSVGNNGATACDVYLSLNGAAATKIVEGATSGAFEYALSDLAAETVYGYTLSISNNAVTVMGAAKSGSFTTEAMPVVPPEEDPDDDDPIVPTGDPVDITALVRAAGKAVVTLEQGVAYNASCGAEHVFDGDNAPQAAAGRFMGNAEGGVKPTAEKPMVIRYDIGSDFESGKKIVLSSLKLIIGGESWGIDRSPTMFALYGVKGDQETKLYECTADPGWQDNNRTMEFPFENGRSFRSYRLKIFSNKSASSSPFISLTEVIFYGHVVGDIAGGEPPAIGTIAADDTEGTNVTITVSGITFGTDDEGVAATSCNVTYAVKNANGSTVKDGTLKNGLAASEYSFELSGFSEDGDYTCAVTITSDKGKSASKSVGFTIATPYDPGAPIRPGETPAETRQTIQDAIDAAAPAHGTVTLAAGLFEINVELFVTNGVTLVGQGWTNTVIRQVTAEKANETHRVITIKGGSTLSGVTVTGGNSDQNYAAGAGVMISDSGNVTWCCVKENYTKRNYGGGIYVADGGGVTVIDHTIVSGNIAGSSLMDGAGGGIAIRGKTGCQVVIDACLVCGNTAGGSGRTSPGGGIALVEKNSDNASVTVRNTTVVGNAVVGNGVGGGVYAGKKSVTLVNCLVAENTSEATAVYGNADVAYKAENLAPAVTTCVIAPVSAGFVGDGDYHLAAGSPAIGAGTVWDGIGNDLDGKAFATTPSIGCYEYGSVPPPATEGWDAPAVTITESTTAGEAWTSLANSILADANAGKLKIWAQGVGATDFAELEFTEAELEAFLLNCTNTAEAIAAAKADFRFAVFDPANPPAASVFDAKGYNGVVTIEGRQDFATGEWGPAADGDKFYRAVLSLK